MTSLRLKANRFELSVEAVACFVAPRRAFGPFFRALNKGLLASKAPLKLFVIAVMRQVNTKVAFCFTFVLFLNLSMVWGDDCSDVLGAVHDIYNTKENSKIDESIRKYDEMTNEKLEETRREFVAKGGGGISLPIVSSLLQFRGGAEKENSESSKNFVWAHLKSGFESSIKDSRNLDSYISVANEKVVQAWADCMKLQRSSKGLDSTVVTYGSAAFSLTLRWDPAVNPQPEAKIESVSLINARLADGQGELKGQSILRTDLTVSFEKVDPTKDSLVTIQTTQGAAVAFQKGNPPATVRIESTSDKLLPIFRQLARGPDNRQAMAAASSSIKNGIYVAWQQMHAYDDFTRSEICHHYSLEIFEGGREGRGALKAKIPYAAIGEHRLEFFVPRSSHGLPGWQPYELSPQKIYSFRVTGYWTEGKDPKFKERVGPWCEGMFPED